MNLKKLFSFHIKPGALSISFYCFFQISFLIPDMQKRFCTERPAFSLLPIRRDPTFKTIGYQLFHFALSGFKVSKLN